MIAREEKKATAEFAADGAPARMRWERPEVRTLATGQAELLSTVSADGGSSFS